MTVYQVLLALSGPLAVSSIHTDNANKASSPSSNENATNTAAPVEIEDVTHEAFPAASAAPQVPRGTETIQMDSMAAVIKHCQAVDEISPPKLSSLSDRKEIERQNASKQKNAKARWEKFEKKREAKKREAPKTKLQETLLLKEKAHAELELANQELEGLVNERAIAIEECRTRELEEVRKKRERAEAALEQIRKDRAARRGGKR